MKKSTSTSHCRLRSVRDGSLRASCAAAALALLAAAPAHANQIWFQQPALSIANTLQIAKGPTPGQFCVIQWQPNPFSSDQKDVPVTWNMAKYTGLTMPLPRSPNQVGTVNRTGSTGAQMSGNVLGVNLNSLDFSPTGTDLNLVGIFPDYMFPDTSYRPFAQPGTTLVYSADMQVVSAALTPPPNNPKYKGQAYVALDLRFQDTSHPTAPQVTVTVGAFAMHPAPPENIGFTTQGGGRILIKTSISPSSHFITVLPDTEVFQDKVWTGFRTFAAAMTADNLSAGIAAITADAPLLSGLGLTAASYSTNPADWALLDVHINAELNYAGPAPYAGGSVQMGWSMRNMMVQLQGTTP